MLSITLKFLDSLFTSISFQFKQLVKPFPAIAVDSLLYITFFSLLQATKAFPPMLFTPFPICNVSIPLQSWKQSVLITLTLSGIFNCVIFVHALKDHKPIVSILLDICNLIKFDALLNA